MIDGGDFDHILVYGEQSGRWALVCAPASGFILPPQLVTVEPVTLQTVTLGYLGELHRDIVPAIRSELLRRYGNLASAAASAFHLETGASLQRSIRLMRGDGGFRPVNQSEISGIVKLMFMYR